MWEIFADAFLIPGCVACGGVEEGVTKSLLGLRLCFACADAWPDPLGALHLEGIDRTAMWPYRGTVRRLLVQAKDMPHCAQAWALRHAARKATLPDFPEHAVWCVTPPSRRRRISDWYLPQFVGTSIAQSKKHKFRRLLKRRQQRRNQSDLSGAERRANLQEVFRWRGGRVPACVILFDDVSTTGATFLEAARALRAVGVAKVYAVCLAAVE